MATTHTATQILKVQEGQKGQGTPSQKVRDFMTLARKRFDLVATTESTLRNEMLEDAKFRASEQWLPDIEDERSQDGRPCLTINRLPVFIRQVTNQQRANRPAVQVNPIDNDADPELAEVLQGIIRNIETNSDADVSYTQGGENQATIGRGYWRVVTEHVADGESLEAFNQELKIKRIRNPFTVYMDPTSQEFDGSDARFVFLIEDVPKEEYVARYGDVSWSSLEEFMSLGDSPPEWMPEGRIRVAEYFYIEQTRGTLRAVVGPDGVPQVMNDESWAALKRMVETQQVDLEEGEEPLTMEAFQVVAEREVTSKRVKHAIINGCEILEGNEDKSEGRDWPGRYIPVVKVVGDEIDINGKVDMRGIVRDARDPQRMYNYWVSAETEMIALAPKAPFMVAKGQLEGHESRWNTANTRNWAYLEYNPIDSSGQPVGPPQRNAFEPPIQALVAATQQADSDLKAVTGFHDPSLGNLSANERSGKAILALQKQGDMANSHFLDNLGRSIRYTGRILLDLIPHIYDTPRIMRIIGDDQKERTVMVGANADQLPSQDQKPAWVDNIYDLSIGKYDVALSVGPSFQARRQEVQEMTQKLVEAYPDMMPVVGDILIANSEIPVAKEMSKRLKYWAISQGVLSPDLADTGEQVPPGAAAKMQALQKQLEETQQQAQAMQQQIQTDTVKAQATAQVKQLDIEAKERIAQLESQVKLLVAQMQVTGEEATTGTTNATKMEIAELGAKVDLIVAALQADTARQVAKDRKASTPTPAKKASDTKK
jgi:hypothetical protein